MKVVDSKSELLIGNFSREIADYHYEGGDYIEGNIISFDFTKVEKLLKIIRADSENQYILIRNGGDIQCRIIKSFQHNRTDIVAFSDNDKIIVKAELPKNVKRVYSSCVENENSRLVATPFGIMNDNINEYRKLQNKKNKIVYSSFNPFTYQYRQKWWLHLKKQKCITFVSHEKEQGDYFKEMAEHSLVICPRGNGLDTHRFWEALYLNCIPIVEDNATSRFFYKYLPVIIIDSWFNFNISNIYSEYKRVMDGSYTMEMLDKSWWKKTIEHDLKET